MQKTIFQIIVLQELICTILTVLLIRLKIVFQTTIMKLTMKSY